METSAYPNLFSREVFCPVPSPTAAILENDKTLRTRKKVGHFMWSYIETLLRLDDGGRCRSDIDFKSVSSKISFLLAR